MQLASQWQGLYVFHSGIEMLAGSFLFLRGRGSMDAASEAGNKIVEVTRIGGQLIGWWLCGGEQRKTFTRRQVEE